MQLKKIFIVCVLLLLIAVVVVLIMLASKGVFNTPPPVSDTQTVSPAETIPTDDVDPDDPEEGMPDLDDELPEGLSGSDLQTRIEAMTISTATGTRPLTSEEKQAVMEDYSSAGAP